MNMSRARGRLLATTIIAGTIAAGPAFAQASGVTSGDAPTSAAATAAADTSPDGVIIVTGSRIASPNLTSASPLQVVGSAAIQSTGAANLQDVLQQNPTVSSPSISRTNSNFQTSDVGEATVDLRNLGTSRTLVLVNGRRFVSGEATAQAVDLNSIPTPFIDHVEVLTGGASSIYGSDAVAGVVNIIYKKNFQGLEANVQAGLSQYGDDSSRQANLMIGGNFAENRGNIMVYTGYSKDGAVASADRSRSAIDQTDCAVGVTGDANDLFTACRPFYSSYAPQGRFFFTNGSSRTFDANGNLTTFSTNGTATHPANGFNRSAYRYIAVPVERYLMATRANYDVTDNIDVFMEGTVAKSHTHSQLEPFPISTSNTNGIFNAEGGFYPIEQRLANGTIFVNPLIPAGLVALATDANGDGLRDISFTRRLSDIGDRTATADRTTYRIVTGVEGQITDKWHFDTYFNYGRTDDSQVSTGQVNLANFRAALEVIPATPGQKGALTLANGTAIQCADPNAVAEGCIPVNVYGANTITSAAAAYLRADGSRKAYTQQIDTGANITGSLWDLWGAGAIGVATGVEYRKESSAINWDALTVAGQNGGNALPNTSGSFDVVEGYGEVRVPILTDKPFFKALEAKGAVRVAHYSSVGTTYSWTYGGTYAPIPDVTFRVEKARATRAPNIAELYQGAAQTFPTGLIDPCVGVTATSAGTRSTVCRSQPGVNANIAANGGTFTQTQADQQGISGYDSGNPNLKAEKADTFTAGVVVAPKSIEALRNFSLTVDYSFTKIKGAIEAFDRAFILSQCYNGGNQAFCSLVTRRPVGAGGQSAGSIDLINRQDLNAGKVVTSAIDVTAGWHNNFDKYGSIDLSVTYTRLMKGYVKPLATAPDIDYFAGELGAAKDKFLVTANYKLGDFGLYYRGTYIGASYLDDQFVAEFTDDNGNPMYGRHDKLFRVGAKYYSDLQFKYSPKERFEFYVGVNNLFNVSPPPIYTNVSGDTTGAETDASDYDAIGRRFYAGARVRF